MSHCWQACQTESLRQRKLSRAASVMVRNAAPNMIESFTTSRPTGETRKAVVRITKPRNTGFGCRDEKGEGGERHEQQEAPDGGQFRPNRVQVVGVTPMAYLTAWRMAIVQTMLRRGEPLKAIAPAVGYESPTALSRIFAQSTGQSPTKWVARSQRYD